MGRISTTVEFRAPRERVWALFTDPARWTEWNTEWSEIRDVRGPFDHPGSGYTQVLRVLGWEVLGTWQVVDCQPLVSRTIAGTLPFGLAFRGRERFEHANSLTRLTVEIEWATPWGWIGRAAEWAMLPLMRRQLAANARRAAALLDEGRAPPP
jgi:hypothetical protein